MGPTTDRPLTIELAHFHTRGLSFPHLSATALFTLFLNGWLTMLSSLRSMDAYHERRRRISFLPHARGFDIPRNHIARSPLLYHTYACFRCRTALLFT